jgi:hypothetical protein
MAKRRLKLTRLAEARKIDLAEKYSARGVATGGGRTGTKKIRRTLEARFVPIAERPAKRSKKAKKGRRRSPPSDRSKIGQSKET